MGEFRSEGRGRSSGGFGRPRMGFGGRSSGGYGGGRSSGGFGGRGGGERRPVEMHDAICAKCKRECQVPFRPSGTKPVLCRDCFSQSDEGSSRGPSRERSFSPRSDNAQTGSSEQMNQINAKLDRIIKVLQDLEIDTSEDAEEESAEEADEETVEAEDTEEEPKRE